MRGNLFIGHTLSKQVQNFDFALRERLVECLRYRGRTESTMLTHMPPQFGGDNRLEQRAPLPRGANCVEDVFAGGAPEPVTTRASLHPRSDAVSVVAVGWSD